MLELLLHERQFLDRSSVVMALICTLLYVDQNEL